MIDMALTIGKYWSPGSESAAMVRAIQCHHDIKEMDHSGAVCGIHAPPINTLQSHYDTTADALCSMEQVCIIYEYAAATARHLCLPTNHDAK